MFDRCNGGITSYRLQAAKLQRQRQQQRIRQRQQQVRLQAEKKDEAAGVVKVIEYDLTDEQYAFGVDKDQPELLEQGKCIQSQRSRRTEPSMRSVINISVTGEPGCSRICRV